MKKIEMYCVTNKEILYLNKIPYNLAAVGNSSFSKKYIRPRRFINPKTKKISYLGETATIHFKPSKSIMKL